MTADELLAWALPQRGLRWRGFRRNRRQVFRRLRARMDALGLATCEDYRAYLAEHPAEWTELDRLCRVTISRFARDRAMWDALLPRLPGSFRTWSAGCGAGEEPYTLAIARPEADILATDLDEVQLARAEAGVYPTSSLRELPAAWRAAAFTEDGDTAELGAAYRARVRFVRHDLRAAPPAGPFALLLCRNLAYSYFAPEEQAAVTARFRTVLEPSGLLVVGRDEVLPETSAFVLDGPGIYVAR